MSRIAYGYAIKGIPLQISSRDFETIEYMHMYNGISL